MNNNQNQVVHINVPMPQLPRMSVTESLGLEAAVTEVQRAFEPIYGQIPHPLNGVSYLRAAIFWALREIDTLVQQGHSVQNIQLNEQLLRQISRASSAGSMQPNEVNIAYENRPFPTQLLFLNLVMFLLRYIQMRAPQHQQAQPPINNNNNVNNNPNC